MLKIFYSLKVKQYSHNEEISTKKHGKAANCAGECILLATHKTEKVFILIVSLPIPFFLFSLLLITMKIYNVAVQSYYNYRMPSAPHNDTMAPSHQVNRCLSTYNTHRYNNNVNKNGNKLLCHSANPVKVK